MTKAQLKEKYLEWNREITKKRLRQDEIFKELQRMNKRYGSGTAYCSIADNVREITKNCKSALIIYDAFELYEEYVNIAGQKDALSDFLVLTKNFDI